MAAAAIPALVTAGAGLLGANKQKKAIERSQREQAAAAAQAQARLQPYQEQGEYATGQIREGLETGTLGGSFTPQDFTQDPSYQFQLEQGEQAQDRLQAARGNIYSGQALKERERFSQGLASQSYQDAYNRWLQTQQNRYNQLAGQQQTGYGAAGGVANIDLAQGQQQAEGTMARRAAQDQGTSTALGAGLNLYNQFNQPTQGGSFGQGGTPGIVPSRFTSY
jgi:hypothetical protein